MLVTTGKIGDSAAKYSDKIMRDTNYQVILLNKQHLLRIEDDPAEIVDKLNYQAGAALTLKNSHVVLM